MNTEVQNYIDNQIKTHIHDGNFSQRVNYFDIFATSLYAPSTLYDHFTDAGNTTTGETILYSDNVQGNILTANGDKIEAEYGGVFVSSGTATREVRIYFGGTQIFDTGALTLSLSSAWTAYVTIIRVSETVVRTIVSFTTEGAALAAYTNYAEVTGLNLKTPNILKITGQAGGVGAATNDIVAKVGSVSRVPVNISLNTLNTNQ